MKLATLEAAQKHAAECYPHESCGLIVMRDDGEAYIPCENSHSNRAEHFRISGEQFADAEEFGDVLAVVHSHPNASSEPSHADRVQCELSELPWHVLSIGQVDGEPDFGPVGYCEPCGFEAPLEGRQFAHGILDCFTLFKDFLWREYGIRVAEYDRDDDWWEKGQELYSMDRLNAEGFLQITDEPKRGDIILMNVRSKVPNHAGVYLGNGEMLHHLHGRLSRRENYGGYWAERTCYIVRHKDMPNG
ncbi:tail tip assembly protein K [Stenotrophomonas phage CUB19]|nr:tail tip assembly protein K [Stenotrophomonas phage CUB19]